METLNQKVKLSLSRILTHLNNLILFCLIFFFVSCNKNENKEEQNSQGNIIMVDTLINFNKITIKTYFKFNFESKGLVKQAEEYYSKESVAFRIDFSENGTNWKNLEIKDYNVFYNVFPLYKNRLGSELYMSNCISCHTSYPSSADKSVCFGFSKYSDKSFFKKFLENKLIDSLGILRHPDFISMDTLEINQIHSFLSKSCGGTTTNTQE